MIDFHTHVLPGMDDGSKNVEMSVSMLSALRAQGVDTVFATPHFYADENDPATFLRRRQRAFEKLAPALPEDAPRLLLGAEVYYYPGIARMEELRRLRLQGTDLLLLEMPFSPWSERMTDEIVDMARIPGITVLLAHINRYLKWQKAELWPRLRQEGVLMQANTEYLLDRWQARKAVRMLRDGVVVVLGTDCHNMSSRAPQMDRALRVLEKRMGSDAVPWLEAQSARLLREHTLPDAPTSGGAAEGGSP